MKNSAKTKTWDSVLSLPSRLVTSIRFRFWHFADRYFHEYYGEQIRREILVAFSQLPASDGGEKAEVLITSFSNKAIPAKLVQEQDKVMRATIRSEKYLWLSFKSKTRAMHYQFIDAILSEALTKFRYVILLDVDCVPFTEDSIHKLVSLSSSGQLAGVEQVSPDHNSGHFYVSPVACCISDEIYGRLGRPSAIQNLNGDVMESFTFAAENLNIPIYLIRVKKVIGEKLWSFPDGRRFGIGTVYAQNDRPLFYHNFCSSTKSNTFPGYDHLEFFYHTCKSILSAHE